MAKTLVGLYDTFSDAEHVVRDLIDYGFARSDVRLITHDAQHRDAASTSYGVWDADTESDVVDMLTELGVPQDDAHSYSEGVRRGGTLVVVESSDEWADSGMEILNRLHPVDIRERRTLWQPEGWTGTTSRTAAATPATNVHRERARTGQIVDDTAEEIVIPVVEEKVNVGKRTVERGRVRVHSRVTERPTKEEVRLREEKVKVERRSADRAATAADLRAAERETVEFTESVEEPVVNKRARVVEEVVIHKDVDERTETVPSSERRTEVDIDRDPALHTGSGQGAGRRRTEAPGGKTSPPSAATTAGFESYADDYRRHYGSTFASSGGAYDDYEPAYRYGYDLGTNERYRSRNWVALEADARRDWEQRHPGTWERFKDAIRHGWDKVRTTV
jgi:stress response protein YsnF